MAKKYSPSNLQKVDAPLCAVARSIAHLVEISPQALRAACRSRTMPYACVIKGKGQQRSLQSNRVGERLILISEDSLPNSRPPPR